MLEELGHLLRGIVLGVVIAAPVGPIGLLCIRRTIESGLPVGLATGLGAAFADTLFSGIAAFGFTAAIEFMMGNQLILQVVGGLFLLAAAAYSFLSPPPAVVPPSDARGLPGAVASGFVLTFTNPITLMGMVAVVAGFGNAPTPAAATSLVAGIFLGSILWWTLLCGSVAAIRGRFTPKAVLWLNRGTGALLAAIAFWALGSAAFGSLA